MVEVTNTKRRSRTVRTANGTYVTLKGGETRDLELTEAQGKRYEKFGRMEAVAGKDPELKPVLSFGKGKLAANPPKPVQATVTQSAPKKRD